MRILQVVTFISEKGSFGGPASVALDQSAELAARGHSVTLLAVGDVRQPTHEYHKKVEVIRFPGTNLLPASRYSFAYIASPSMLWFIYKNARSFDLAHIHLARDLVTVPAAAMIRRKIPFVAQPHGMVDASSKFLARLLDRGATRSILARADRVLALTDEEQDELTLIQPKSRILKIRNGVPTGPDPTSLEDRPRQVLFAARLHIRKRPTAFVKMAGLVAARLPDVNFVVAGPDEGELGHLETAIEASEFGAKISYAGALSREEVAVQMRSSSVYVLPSVGEVFPVSILEAWREGTPTVVTRSLGIAADCIRFGSAVVTDGTPASLADAVVSLLEDPALALATRQSALRYLDEYLSIESTVDQLLGIYAGSMS